MRSCDSHFSLDIYKNVQSIAKNPRDYKKLRRLHILWKYNNQSPTNFIFEKTFLWEKNIILFIYFSEFIFLPSTMSGQKSVCLCFICSLNLTLFVKFWKIGNKSINDAWIFFLNWSKLIKSLLISLILYYFQKFILNTFQYAN